MGIRKITKYDSPESKTRLYRIWQLMKRRCNYPACKSYKDYGGRGISVCVEWNDFRNFKQWAMEHGYSDSLTIERIDVNGNYCPENCTWVTIQQQGRNRRNTAWVIYKGQKMCISEACRLAGISVAGVRKRQLSGMDINEAITKQKAYGENSLLQKAALHGIKYSTVYHRIHELGWSEDKALNEPTRIYRKKQ